MNEECRNARDRIAGRKEGREQVVVRLELSTNATPIAVMRLPPLVVDQLANRIRELVGAIRGGGAPDRIDVKHPVVSERQERVVDVR